MALTRDSTRSFNVMPILLLGEPGVGKTRFAKKLGALLEVPTAFVALNTATAGWTLTGSDSSWRGASMGRVAKTLLKSAAINPVMVLDEADKAQGSDQSRVLDALLQLMEPETAEHFEDEFLQLPLNARHVFFILTANDLGRLPGPLLSRLQVFHIRNLTRDERRTLAGSMYRELQQGTPRQMKQVMLASLGEARLRGHADLREDCVRSALDAVRWGAPTPGASLDARTRYRVAVHEAGHALVSALRQCGTVERVSIAVRGDALGLTAYEQEGENAPLLTLDALLKRLERALAGRVAEQLMCQELSTGAAQDLAEASRLAYRMVTRYGMGAKRLFSLAALAPDDTQLTPELVEQAELLLQGAQASCQRLLRAHAGQLKRMTDALLQHGDVPGDQVRSIARKGLWWARLRYALIRG